MKAKCRVMRVVLIIGLLGLFYLDGSAMAFAQQESEAETFESTFAKDLRPLLNRFCVECHTGDEAEAEIDLSASQTFDVLGKQIELWQKVREVLRQSQMPPEGSPQPNETESAQLNKWVHDWLKRAAQADAGDPGPVILRRLSNAEYNYTIQDLTGVNSLNPTREFPVDGAAGEGFTNSGAAQGMSPALMSKYLDAAHEVAQHLVLLPDGIRFSPLTSRRDHSDEHLRLIQDFYSRFADEGGGMPVDLQGIKFDTNQGGVIPLALYFQATIAHRDELRSGKKSVDTIAEERSLNPKYLASLWDALSREDRDAPALGLSELRKKWNTATINDVPQLVAYVEQAQKMLWRFNPVGQIGRAGGPVSWMEAVSPIVTNHEFSLPLATAGEHELVVYLAAANLSDNGSADTVEWQHPRLEFGNGGTPILLRDVRALSSQIESLVATAIPATARYLSAVRVLRTRNESIESLAESRDLNRVLLKAWAAYLGLGPASREINGHFTERLHKVAGYEAINGWGSPQTPSILSNRSGDTISFSTLTLPARSVFVHPSPALESVIAWRSPLDGKIKLDGIVADADNNCGNGVEWSVLHQNSVGLNIVKQGSVATATQPAFAAANEIEVQRGDVISLVINPRSADHSCDTTRVDLTLTEVGGQKRVWNLVTDIVDRIQDGNPLADKLGNSEVWHFCSQAISPESRPLLPVGSSIAEWRAAIIQKRPNAEIEELEKSIQHLVTVKETTALNEGDREFRRQLLAWNGPLHWSDAAKTSPSDTSSVYGLDAAMFGTHPNGTAGDAANLCLEANHALEIKLPAQLLADATFRTTGTLHAADGSTAGGGAMQLRVSISRPVEQSASWFDPIIANPGPSREKLERALDEFRELFPAALCYGRIVPVDEVVTLTLYHREDTFFQRLMLNDEQRTALDRLWDQLLFVSQEPLLLTTAFEQISEFATQDRPDLVTAFSPMRGPIYERAEAFRRRMIAAEPLQLAAIIQLAGRAWRRPLSTEEEQKLRDLYRDLRQAELPHEEALALTLARVLTSPAFVYKLERAGQGTEPTPISPSELATRLSYFLWSSLPDDALTEVARNGQLAVGTGALKPDENITASSREHEESLQQTRRMLRDPRIRRMAIQFACQWLHVRDFDQNNDKNEQMFPEFVQLRGDMYEETVRYFEDMIRNDGSILDILDGDHTFVNEAMARHYGITGVQGNEWQKLAGMRARGRGGILGMASVLASQSGASRTSPILRGVWVSETLLGERLPRPPADVPKLPDAVPDGFTTRQLIELHSSQPQCAKCHVRIDPYGFALEQFDTIGRMQAEPVDTAARLMDGTKIDGIAGMQAYIATTRRDEFVQHFCQKLLGYALGREVLLSDEPLLDQMQQSLEQNGFRFSVAVEAIVTSHQFRTIRGRTAIEPSR